MKHIIITFTAAFVLVSCTIVRPGEVGVKRNLGKLGKVKEAGAIWFFPFTTKVIKVSTRTINRELSISLPSKEGLTIQSDISILYHIKTEMVKDVIEKIGTQPDFDRVVTAVFRSAAADVCARFYAKDMHSGERDNIEKEIKDRMNSKLSESGFVIEEVLLKSIALPAGLADAIEEKLEAEQQTQRMEFVLTREIKEAERKKVEATGERDANLILSEGLTPLILKLRQIEVLKEIAKSNNSKVVITNGGELDTPLMLKADDTE